MPRGLTGYVSGQVVLHSLGIAPSFAVILVPGMFLFDDLMQNGAAGWATVLWVTLLGLLATPPPGNHPRIAGAKRAEDGDVGLLPGDGSRRHFRDLLPDSEPVDVVAMGGAGVPDLLLGLGMRSAFLPESAAALEVDGSWRTAQTVVVLLAWAIAGLLIAPRVLTKMARRQTGSAVEAARSEAGQWVR